MGGTAIHGRKKRQVIPLFAEEKLALCPLPAERATVCAARPFVRRSALQRVGIASSSSSLRLARHSMELTPHTVQLLLLGSRLSRTRNQNVTTIRDSF